MAKIIPSVVALMVLAAYGLAEGLWTDRWQTSHEAEQAAARLADVPRTVGDWDGTDEELDARQVAVAQLLGHVMRKYTHRESGAAVTVLLVCGRPGPIAVHTPDVCFRGAGYALPAAPERQKFEADTLPAAPEFWS